MEDKLLKALGKAIDLLPRDEPIITTDLLYRPRAEALRHQADMIDRRNATIAEIIAVYNEAKALRK